MSKCFTFKTNCITVLYKHFKHGKINPLQWFIYGGGI